MNELEASGKKVSGGMHKFDSSEVDVNGGNATADDFMDAFGFGGGDGDGDCEEVDETVGHGMLAMDAAGGGQVRFLDAAPSQ